jgi:hypothetical protein
VSIVPGPIGSAAAVADAGLYAYEGDYESAAISLVAVVPFGGPILSKGEQALKVVTKVRKADEAADAAIHIEKAVTATDKAASNIVYRGLAEGEDPALGLTARNPLATNSPVSHVAGKRDSQWISTTKSLDVAMSRFGKNGVVQINLDQVAGEVVDLSHGIPGLPKNAMLSHWAMSAQEVLIRGSVPAKAMRAI